MVSKVIIRLEDDLDGSEAAETIQFMVDNVEYEIDLSEPNANRFRNSFSEFVSHARKVGGRRRSAAKSFGGVDTKDVRAWAQANGVEVSERGRISADVLDKYRAAGH